MNYKLTATTCNETIAFQFIEFWTAWEDESEYQYEEVNGKLIEIN